MKIDKQWVEKINQLEFKNDVAIVEHSNFTFAVKRITDFYNTNNEFNFGVMIYNSKQGKYCIENFTYNELTFFYVEIVDNNLLNLMYKDGNEIIGITYKILNDSIIDFKRIYENKEVIFDKPLSFTVEQAKNLFVFETSNNEFNEFYYNLNGKVLYKVLKDKSGSKLKQVNYFNNLDDVKVIRYFKNNYLSRDDGPAIIKYSKEGEILEKHFYKNGTYVCSSKCPGYIEYDDDNGKAVTSFFYDKVVFNRKNFPATYEFEFQKEKCTSIYGVPTMFIGMMNHPMFDMFDMSSLRTGIMAGSTCPVETMKDAIEKMNMKEITSVYGLTEAAPGFTQTNAADSFEKKINTVGRKFPNIEVKIVDPETGEEVGVGETGEIMCRGFNVMKGYYNMPEKTAEAIEPDGWLHSGDLAKIDEDGYYSIVGRIKDMIIRGGENIYPREIEEFLFTHDCVRDVQVAGIPDEKYGEIVGAFIIREDGFDDITEADIRDFCIGSIARYKVPKYVFFVDEFPLTTSGKIQKYKLGDIGLKLLDERRERGEL